MTDDRPTIGVLGGMSAASTAEYYRGLNERVNDALGGHHAAEVVVYSVDFGTVEPLIAADRWDEAGARLADAATALESTGADFVLVATNTMHRVAPAVEDALSVPLVHIVDVTAEAARERGIDTVGVLGTRPVMDGGFYRERFADHGVEVVVPDERDRDRVHDVIFDELTHGVVTDDSRAFYCDVMDDLVDAGAEAIVLGCTEIELLVDEADFDRVPLLDTTALHVERAAELHLGERPLPAASTGTDATAGVGDDD
jgi:aspartate racemase